jgi:hypothetical protein
MAGHCETIVRRKYVKVCDENGDEIIEEEKKANQNRSGRSKNSETKQYFHHSDNERSNIQLRHMVPTSLGMNFAEAFLLQNPSLVESKLRASMELQIASIANGSIDSYKVLNDNITLFRNLYYEFQLKLHRVLHLFTHEKKRNDCQTLSLMDFLKK